MRKSTSGILLTMAVVTLAGLGISRADETAGNPAAKQPARKHRAQMSAAAPTSGSTAKQPVSRLAKREFFFTPTGSHIPEKYTISGRDADTTLPMTVISRADIDALEGNGDLGNALRHFPYITVRGR